MSLRILLFFAIGFFGWFSVCYPADRDTPASSQGHISSASAGITATARVEHPLGMAELAEESSLWGDAVYSMISDYRAGCGEIETSFRQILYFPDQSGLIIQIETPYAETCRYDSDDVGSAPGDMLLPGLSERTIVLNLSSWATAVSSHPATITITIIDSAI